jgi:hypothetical protein
MITRAALSTESFGSRAAAWVISIGRCSRIRIAVLEIVPRRTERKAFASPILRESPFEITVHLLLKIGHAAILGILDAFPLWQLCLVQLRYLAIVFEAVRVIALKSGQKDLLHPYEYWQEFRPIL